MNVSVSRIVEQNRRNGITSSWVAAGLSFTSLRRTDPFSTASSCYAFVDDARALHDEWAAIVVDDPQTGSRLIAPMETDYGMTEFAVIDPSGNLIRVGSPVPS
jgi:hypothetical protein